MLEMRSLDQQETAEGFLGRGDLIRFVFWKDHSDCLQEVIDLEQEQRVGVLLEVMIVQVGPDVAWMGRVTVEVKN